MLVRLGTLLLLGDDFLGSNRGGGSLIDVDIGKDDQRVLAAELQRERLDASASGDRQPGLHAAGESDAPDILVCDQRAAAGRSSVLHGSG